MPPDALVDQPDEERTITWSAVKLEGEILDTLAKPPIPGERLDVAFRRKERELEAIFERLTLEDTRQLHRRLTLMLPTDPLAIHFGRLVPERRSRLLAFLADARRREVLRNIG